MISKGTEAATANPAVNKINIRPDSMPLKCFYQTVFKAWHPHRVERVLFQRN